MTRVFLRHPEPTDRTDRAVRKHKEVLLKKVLVFLSQDETLQTAGKHSDVVVVPLGK